MVGEKLCLQWNDFSANITSAFGDLKADKDFTDVTLACDDGQYLDMHKFVLISSSPFFRNLLKNNKHSHPLIYMRSTKFENLTTMVDFLYQGEANVSEDIQLGKRKFTFPAKEVTFPATFVNSFILLFHC